MNQIKAWYHQALKVASRVLSSGQLADEQGFTLVEVMIVGVIVAVMMLGFSGYMFQQMKANQAQDNKQNYSQLKGSVLDATSQSDSIQKSEGLDYTTFGGATPAPTP